MPLPENMLPTKLLGTQSPPMLWIGAGMSKRYLSLKDWDGLLEEIAYKIGFDKDTYTARKGLVLTDLPPDARREDIMVAVGSFLSKAIYEKIAEDEIEMSDAFDDCYEDMFFNGTDPLKLAICSLNRDVTFNGEHGSELELFRKLLPCTPVIVTTNCDRMIEELCGGEYAVYSELDDCYRDDVLNTGEIYKIRGSADRPDSLIVTAKDHARFNGRYQILMSKLVSLICENPVVIMGYSMTDKFMGEMLENMFRTFSESVCERIARNILYIGHTDSAEPELGTFCMNAPSGFYRINYLKLNDYSPVYEDLLTCTRSYPVSQARKIKGLLMDVVRGNDQSKMRRVMCIGADSVDDLDRDKAVIGLANPAAALAMKSFSPYTVDDLLDDIFDRGTRLPPESVIRIWFENPKLTVDQYLPIFPYLSKLDLREEDYSPKLVRYIEKKREQCARLMNRERPPIFRAMASDSDLVDAIGSDFKYQRADMVLHCFMNGVIDEARAMELLKTLHTKTGNRTWTRRAVTLVHFIEYEKRSGLACLHPS